MSDFGKAFTGYASFWKLPVISKTLGVDIEQRVSNHIVYVHGVEDGVGLGPPVDLWDEGSPFPSIRDAHLIPILEKAGVITPDGWFNTSIETDFQLTDDQKKEINNFLEQNVNVPETRREHAF